MSIADMKVGTEDSMGDAVRSIYGFKPPEYAVYATDKRLVVRYADEPNLDSQQRKGLAPLNPVRGEINGLIDGWRVSRNEALRAKASRYDRRVAMIRAGRYRAVTVKGRKYVGYSADDIAKIEAALKQEGS